MSRSACKRRVRSWVLVAAGFTALAAPSWLDAADPEYSLEEITARLKEWQAKIVTLRLTIREESDPKSKMAKEAHLAGVQRVGYSDWIWTDTAAIRNHRWVTYDGVVKMRSMGIVGAHGDWQAQYRDGPSEEAKPAHLDIQLPGARAPLGGMVIMPLYGLWLPGPDGAWLWLGDRMAVEEFELLGTSAIDGRRCAHLRTPGIPTLAVARQYWLDPDRGFLPVQVEEPGYPKFTVAEFVEPEPGVYVPKRGRFVSRMNGEITDTNDWEVTSIELNQPIPAALWNPPIADGTEVYNSATNTQYVQGGKALNPEIVQDIVDAAIANPAGPPARAERSGGGELWLSGGFVLVAVLLVGGAFQLWRRGR